MRRSTKLINSFFSNQRSFVKSFIYTNGYHEEIEDFQRDYRTKLKGYGVGYSHPRHLNEYHGFNIKSFRDMDQALDELQVLRCYEDNTTKQINIGTKCTKEQLILIENIFNNSDKIVKIKITSISKKWYADFESFKQALKEKLIINEDFDNREFKTHTMELMN